MDKNFWMKWGISGMLALASGHAALFDIMYPCPAALLAVTVSKSYSGWKLALMAGVSLWFGRRQGTAVWGELIALGAVWLLMLYLSRRGTAPVNRALAAAGLWVVTKGVVLWRLGLFYRYGFGDAAAEAALVVVFTYIFFKLYAFIRIGKLPLIRPEGILVLVSSAAVFFKAVPSVQAAKVGLFLMTLWIGHRGGVKEGAVAGVVSGTMLSAITRMSPDITTILACGGMAAGLCKNEGKKLAAMVFSATTLFFGLARGFADLYVAVYVPVLASLFFLIIPERIERKLRKVLVMEEQAGGFQLVMQQQILQTLEGYRRTFQYLSRAYILQRESFYDEPHIRSGRRIMAYQFKGMADAVERLENEIRTPSALPVKRERRYRLKVGKAGASGNGQVSGDSVYYGEVRRGCYAVALSDGMGSGRKAAEESNLTVQTMYRLLTAGFQPELALRIMNSILLYGAGDEIYSTLDLALIDLYTGNLQLYKTGASLTLLRRGDQVEVVKIPALPMGIVGDIPVPSVDYRLKPGDQILLLSDGVADAGRHQGIQWLTEAIASLTSSDPQTVADLLIQRAMAQAGTKEKDDMTAVVIVVQNK